MTPTEQIDSYMRDIRGIVEVLEPVGAKWAKERKKERERYENENCKMDNRVSLEEI